MSGQEFGLTAEERLVMVREQRQKKVINEDDVDLDNINNSGGVGSGGVGSGGGAVNTP